MTAQIVVRECRSDECATVLAIWKDAEAIATATDTLEALSTLVEENPGSLLIAEIDGQPCGTIIAAWDGWRGNIYRLAVIPRRRRRGVARVLVLEAQRRLQARGAHRISLYAMRDDAHVLGFWDSLQDLGYRRDPTKMRYVRQFQTDD